MKTLTVFHIKLLGFVKLATTSPRKKKNIFSDTSRMEVLGQEWQTGFPLSL